MARAFVRTAAAALALLAVGFVAFVGFALTERRPSWQPADGIVVLTGGEDRIAVAIGLLNQGIGKRLLITGVNPRTSAAAIGRQTGQRGDLFRCCIDIGRAANDTVGNAEETRDWVRARGFASLVVVTSSYHMPRALCEFARAMPGVTLNAYPVVSRHLRQHPLWRSPATLKLLASEYLKLLASATRLGLSKVAGLVGMGTAMGPANHAGCARCPPSTLPGSVSVASLSPPGQTRIRMRAPARFEREADARGP